VVDGADGGERSDAFFVEETSYGFGPTGQTLIVEMEPFDDNDLFDLVAGAGVEVCGALDQGITPAACRRKGSRSGPVALGSSHRFYLLFG
jgi:hypothetical protein